MSFRTFRSLPRLFAPHVFPVTAPHIHMPAYARIAALASPSARRSFSVLQRRHFPVMQHPRTGSLWRIKSNGASAQVQAVYNTVGPLNRPRAPQRVMCICVYA